ncbi:diacylglycerol/lipid kinase family protein [Limosilactobacillus antri]|uniref:Diacylglycerol kinase catalytic domain protein n=1 Tax=Limosilactobacillus antri DSM 16041 TaxID=525309 RepID=C8P8H7_9LACO|nr:YegS/Rv2252/BmrU family lipid kinase [Limosilactobacillus antri]EEW53191.1 lipid kinase, YegS/Rv2252/BmrU family [Limosilactobacillus antri DSM 16041]KRK59705.1 diacylglycerol kinase catalytic domain protein [Limosilactobacillus antri DSM 16041]
MRYLFLINPHSGSGKGLAAWQKVHRYLAGQQVDYQTVVSKYPGHPRELAAACADCRPRGDCLVVIGGDGTLHEALTGLIMSGSRPCPIAYIPAGTGNDFARGYRISTDPLEALRQILNNRRSHPINVGRYRELSTGQTGIFLNNFGIGFDAAIVHATNHSRAKEWLNHHHLGTFAYVSKALHALFTQPAFTVRVADGGKEVVFPRGFLLIASNHPYIGGGICVAPDQRITERQLELVVVEKRGWLSLLGAMLAFACGRITTSSAAHVFRGEQLRYRIQSAQYGQVDGEEPGRRAFDLELACQEYPVWQEPLAK